MHLMFDRHSDDFHPPEFDLRYLCFLQTGFQVGHGGPRVLASTPAAPVTDTFLGFLTITNGSAGAATDAPFQIMWPLAKGQMAGAKTLRVYDDDGSGGKGTVLANFQVGAVSTDLDNDKRLVPLHGIVPSVDGSGGAKPTRKLWVEESSTAAPTGTSITEADLFATAWRLIVDFNIAGSTTSVDTNNLNGASSTFNKANPVYHGSFADGPCCRVFVYSAPVQAGGDGIRVWFHIYVWKAGTGAVNGGNPITLVDCDIVLRNFDTERSAPNAQNYLYGFQVRRATSLSNGTLITTDQTDIDGNVTRSVYARSQPAATLTATGATGTGFFTWTRSTGNWDSDILGAHITAGAGAAYVVTRNSNTSIDVFVYSAFSATSFTSGNWTVEGVGHWYGGTWTMTLEIGTVNTCKVLWGNNTSAMASTTTAGRDLVVATKLLNNYVFPFSDVTFDMTDLNLMRADNAIRPFTLRGPTGFYMGDMQTYIGQSGDRIEIGQNPKFSIDGMTKYTGDGRRKMNENSLYLHTASYYGIRRYSGSPSVGALGVVPAPGNGTNWKFNTGFSGQQMNFPPSWQPWDGDNGHQPNPHYIPYLCRARLIYLERMQEQYFYEVQITEDAAYCGTGLNKTPFGDSALAIVNPPWGSLQQRANAWNARALGMATICTPDAANDGLYVPKSQFKTAVQNMNVRAKFVIDTFTNGTPPNDFYGTSSPRYTGFWFEATGNTLFSAWQGQGGYGMWAYNTNRELGLGDSNLDAFLDWMSKGTLEAYSSPDTVADYTTTPYYQPRLSKRGAYVSGAPTTLTNWADSWQAFALWGPTNPDNSAQIYRVPASITLSAVSGPAIQADFTGSPFGAGAWYTGDAGKQITTGCIYEPSTGGIGEIVSVTNANRIVINTELALSNTNIGTISATGDYFQAPDYWVRAGRMIEGNTIVFSGLSEPLNNGVTYTIIFIEGTRLHVTPSPTAMPNDTTWTANVSRPFSSTTPTAANIRIPAPNPADKSPDGTLPLAQRDLVYMWLYRLATVFCTDLGKVVPAAAARTYITTSTGYSSPATKLNIDPR